MTERLIAFDVDSTLLRVESLDITIETALAGRADEAEARTRLHALTRGGMTGQIALRESLETRIGIASLTLDQIRDSAERLRKRVTPGIKPVLARLREQGDALHAISGGFTDLLEPVLTDLGFTASAIHANRFTFEADRITGLDTGYPLSRNGGKAEILSIIGQGASEVIMVGDGMTDFEAYEAGAADRFIGFGVVAQREVVIAAAEHSGGEYVRSVDALATALRRPTG